MGETLTADVHATVRTVARRLRPDVAATRADTEARGRIADAVLRCIAERGAAATTVEEIAREAGMGRATVYRHFPGGRSELLLAAAEREVTRCAALIDAELSKATGLDELVVVALVSTLREVRSSAPLQELLEREPDVVLPHLMVVDGTSVVFELAAALARPHLDLHLDPRRADLVIELVVRLVLSWSLSPAAAVDLSDPDAIAAYAQRLLVPAVHALSALPDDRLPALAAGRTT